MKKLILAIILLTTGLVGANAQKAGYDPVNARFGHGQDSIDCVMNLSLMATAAKAENYADALPTWTSVYNNCPASSKNIYIYGPRIYKALFAKETDAAKKKEYLDKIMEIYDTRMKYFSKADAKGTILAFKASDYQELMGEDADPAVVYKMLGEAVEDMKSEMYPSDSYGHYMISSLRLFLDDNLKKDQYIKDYFRVMDYMDEAKENAIGSNDTENANYLEAVKATIENAFVNSGAGDCKTLINFYQSKFAENKNNEEFLNQASGSLSNIGCTDSEFYFELSENLHRLKPSANSAIGLANRSLNNKDFNEAMKYYEQAAELETDKSKSSEYLMTLAKILFSSQRNYSKARQYAYDALKFNPNNGGAYILIAQMYATSAASIFPEAEKRGLVFGAAVDKLQRAKSVDSSVTSEANRLINQYSGYYMDKETAFMMGIKDGESVFVPGWIGENTTVRTK